MDFNKLKVAVAAQFERMQKHPMYRVDVSGDELWQLYLSSFPAGTNPIYRERTEHDCSCCKQFVRTIGNVVAVIDGALVSVWDIGNINEVNYCTVAHTLAELVKSKPIANPFLHYEKTAGTDKNFEDIVGGTPKRWDHFFVNIKPQFVMEKPSIPTKLGEDRTAKEMLEKSFMEISDDAIDTVLDLITQGSLYRGEEHKFAITEFRKLKREWTAAHNLSLDDTLAETLYVWTASKTAPASVARMKNTAVGTLLVNLSEGMDLEEAVKKFEAIMAPANYKRPTALVTKAMIEKAKVTVNELGLTSALDRRYAVLRDIEVNNVLWADRSARKVMGDVFDDLASKTSSRVKALDKIEEVPIAKFLTDILPKVESVELLLENKHTGNLVSLIAPTDPTAGRLFKWGNPFSWSYNGEFADSIKERVKKAGGNVTGDLCCRLAWDYTDDLDFHMQEPNGAHIFWNNRRSPSGGVLDVDANGQNGMMPQPVENIFYADRSRLKEGVYDLSVHNYNRRGSSAVGFDAEIDFMGTVYSFNYKSAVRQGETVLVAKFKYSHAKGVEIIESLPSQQASRQAWGLPTQTFHKVNVVLLSPNFWDLHPNMEQVRSEAKVGNKHYFFMLEGCANDGTARGFYNEFLDARLDPHRKVLEMVGSKLKPAASADQLSGLGFSSTQRSSLTVRLKGSFTRTINITF